MKKLFYIVAVATLAFISCQQQELDPVKDDVKNEGFTFKASIEQLSDGTKGAINAENALVWATDDKIGIYVDDDTWADKNQPFTLSNGAGTTQGEFSWDYSGSFSDKAAAAFYPWDDNDTAGDGTNNNVYEGYAYFTLHDGIYSYSSGKMLTPLVASLSGSTDKVSFKHAGAAVKVHINNVPKRVHSIGMTVNGQQVTGEFKVSVANAGTDAMVPVTADAKKNSVWINIWNGSESAWDFIFPVPELTKPKLSFQMWDENDILVWSKNLKAQASDLGRGDLLVMPDLTITPYSQFTESTEWTLCGKIGGIAAWDADIPMYTDGTVTILKGMTFKAGDEFKIRKNKAWDESYPGSNYAITGDCTKDVWFNNSTHEITLKDAKCDYPAPKVTLYFGINGAIPNGIAISSSTLAPGAEWPGLELTEKEYINGKWYYKHVVDGTTVWGKSIPSVYIVSISSWNTSGSTLTFSDIKTEYYFEATSATEIEQLSARPADATALGITIDGDMSDWASILPLTSDYTSRIRSWKFDSDANNIYFYFVLRKNRMSSASPIKIAFSWDDSNPYTVDDFTGCEASVVFQPFTNSVEGTPNCVNGTINDATINGSAIDNAGIIVYGSDPNASDTGDNADYYIEVSIPKSKIPDLPASGTIQAGATYAWYETGFRDITL